MAEMISEEPSPRRRPFGLFVIIGLQLLVAVVLGLSLVGLEEALPLTQALVYFPLFYTWVGWLLIGTLFLTVIGLIRLKRWGWVLTMLQAGVALSFSIWQYFQGIPSFIVMTVYIIIVFYLNQRDVQSPFVRWNPPSDSR